MLGKILFIKFYFHWLPHFPRVWVFCFVFIRKSLINNLQSFLVKMRKQMRFVTNIKSNPSISSIILWKQIPPLEMSLSAFYTFFLYKRKLHVLNQLEIKHLFLCLMSNHLPEYNITAKRKKMVVVHLKHTNKQTNKKCMLRNIW